MCSLQDLIEKAKIEINEDVEFFQAPPNIEIEMQKSGEIARYDFNHDIIYCSKTMISSRNQECQIQTFMHELAHVKDLRDCVANGLLKIILPPEGSPDDKWRAINEHLHTATEFQISNFLYSNFDFTLPSRPKFHNDLETSLYYALIPAIEYFHFGEDKNLKDKFEHKLDDELDEKWKSISSLLKALKFADSHSFETEFVKLSYCLGFSIQIKNKLITEKLRENFKILQINNIDEIKIIELINFDFSRSIFSK